MKRAILAVSIIMLTAVLVTGASAGPLSARIGVGALFWYCWWQPPWADGTRFSAPRANLPASIPYRVRSYENSSAPLFGFTVLAEFLKSWYFSSSLLFGNYLSRSASAGPNPPAALSRLSYIREIKRYDFEAYIGYRVNRYFSAYLCLKTRAYDFTERINNAVVTGTDYMAYKATARGEHIDVGPGLGISVTAPMPAHENIFLLFQASGMVLATSSSYVNDYQYQILNGTLSLPVGQYDRESFYSWCGEGALSLGYTLEPAGITFMLGGKYEVVYYRHHRLIKGFLRYNGNYDHSYGVTFMLAYAVTLTAPSPVKM